MNHYRVDQLEKAQVVNTERFKIRTKELKGAVQKDLEEATIDAAGDMHLNKYYCSILSTFPSQAYVGL
jgi:hypothetical protein